MASVFTLDFSLAQTKLYDRFEHTFVSSKSYKNPLYDLNEFDIEFTSPSGRKKTVRGFWDGGTTWKVRFMPDELGEWTFTSFASDKNNSGLNEAKGTFNCIENSSDLDLYKKGNIVHTKGTYHLSHSDGTPFFWTACTAWNGALKSTPEEWDFYLNHRLENSYNTVQLVTTQWRGSMKNAEGKVAFKGSGHIELDPEFFNRIDERIEEANRKGLLVSPVVLWALPFGDGTEYSPGYYLPIREAVILAKYIVARYQGNHVVWNLGGDGKYYGDLEERWKTIGREVFGAGKHQGLVTLHPHGLSWIGEIYEEEPWYEIYTYQSSHSISENTINWINKGPMSQKWSTIRPLPFINTEPLYEDILTNATPLDIRNAWYWSLFSTPVAGITYGANGIWPWLNEGEDIENHGPSHHVNRWKESLELPGSIQMGYLNQMFSKLEWWSLKPANELLVDQPGDQAYKHFISVLATEDRSEIIIYTPVKQSIRLFDLQMDSYSAQWFDPITNTYSETSVKKENHMITINNELEQDRVLILKRE